MSGWLTNGMSLATLPFTGNERFPLDTQLASGATPEMEAASLSQVANMMGGAVPLVASRFYGLPRGATPGTLLTVLGTMYAYPFYVPGPTTISTIGIYTTTGQTGGAGRVGIYADNGSGYPGNLVSGGVSGALIATSGAASQTTTISLTLQAGWYWLASIYTASTTQPTVASAAVGYGATTNAMLGSDTAAHLIATSAQAASGISVTGQTYGALTGINSGVFPSGATLTLNADTPLVILGT